MAQAHMLLLGFPGVSEEEYWKVVHYLENNQQHQWPPQQMLWLVAYRDQHECLRVAEGYSDPAAINFEVLKQALQVCDVARPAERELFPVTYFPPADPKGVASLLLEQLVVLEARYPQAGLAAYQRVMAHQAIAQFAPMVVVHAGGEGEDSNVHVFNLFPNQETANQASALLSPVFAELQSPATDRKLTGKVIDFRWLAVGVH